MFQKQEKDNTNKKWEDMTERERMFMKDKHGLPMNKALKGKTGNYGALAQH